MAVGRVYKRGSTWTWRIDDLTSVEASGTDRPQPSKGGFRTRKEAQTALDAVRAQMASGTWAAPTDLTVADYLEQWLQTQAARVKPATLHSYGQAVVRIQRGLGRRGIQTLTPLIVENFYAALLTDGLSPKTVRNTHTVLRKSMADAERLGVVSRNVAASARPPRAERPEFSVWSSEELKSFLDGIRDDAVYPVFVLLATTGMRRGEALGLRHRDVDFAHSQVAIVQTLSSVAGKISISTPKSARSRRNVVVDAHTLAVLKQRKADQARERLAAGPAWEGDGDLVFTDEFGRPVHPDALSRSFRRLVAESGLRPIRLHDLRHTYATLALRGGIHPKVVSSHLGHSTVAITLDLYSHVTPSMARDAANVVSSVIFD